MSINNKFNYGLRVENIVTKGEIAHHEQFLLLQQCFQKSLAADLSASVKREICGVKVIKYVTHKWTISQNLSYLIHFVLRTSFALTLFPHMTILQQTTLNIFCQKIENLYN